MLIQTHGIVSQGGITIVGSRPASGTSFGGVATFKENPASTTFDASDYTDDAFTVGFWFKQNSAAVFTYGFGREVSSATRSYYALIYNDDSGTAAVNFYTSPNGSAVRTQNLYPTSLVQYKWYYVVFSATLSGPLKRIYLFDESSFLTSGETATYDGVRNNDSMSLCMNVSRLSVGGEEQIMNAFGFWSRFMNAEEATELWNYGAGLSYADLSAAQKTSLVEWWDMDDWDGTDITGDEGGINMILNTGSAGDISTVAI